MPNPKIEPNLEAEIDRAEAAKEPERRIPILIELVGAPATGMGKGTAELGELAGRVGELQRGIVERLSELGAEDLRQATLANAVSARLTPAHVLEIAERGDVKLVRLNREEYVTTT